MKKKTVIKIILITAGILIVFGVINFAVLLSLGFFVDKEKAKILESFQTLEQRQKQPGHEKDYTGLHPFVVALQRMKNANDEELLKEKKMYEEMNASNIGDALAPENLTNTSTLTTSRQKITHMIEIINQFETGQAKVDPLAILQKIIEEEHVPAIYQKILIQTTQVNYPEMLTQQKERTELERQYLLSMDDLLAFMEQRHGTYRLNGNVIAFSKQSDIDIYNSSMQKLEQINEKVKTAWKNFAGEGDKYKTKFQQDVQNLENRQ